MKCNAFLNKEPFCNQVIKIGALLLSLSLSFLPLKNTVVLRFFIKLKKKRKECVTLHRHTHHVALHKMETFFALFYCQRLIISATFAKY